MAAETSDGGGRAGTPVRGDGGPAQVPARPSAGEDIAFERAPAGAADQAREEQQEDAQSGDLMAPFGFFPGQVASHYLRQVSQAGSSGAIAARIEELADKLVDRILVRGPDTGGPEEMRLHLVNEVLDGAEIWMRREEGELRLVFVTSTERSELFMSEHGKALSDAVEERTKNPVRVVVRRADEEA